MTSRIIRDAFKPIIGLPCWGLNHERYLNLSMNFGKPSLRIVREPFKSSARSPAVRRNAARRIVSVRGEWWLWIYCCYWRLILDGHVLVTGSSSFPRIERAIRRLQGQKLVSVEVKPETGATRFAFDLGAVLDCRRFERDSDEQLWTLYQPRGYVLAVHGNGTFIHDRGAKPKPRLRPMASGIRK